MAHRLIAVVAAEEHLRAAGHNLSVLAYSRVDGRLSAAAADGLYLGYGIRDLEQPAASRENIRQEIGTQPEAEHRNIAFVNYSAKLIYLVFCKKLALIRNNDIRVAAFLAEPARDASSTILAQESVRMTADRTAASLNNLFFIFCVYNSGKKEPEHYPVRKKVRKYNNLF